MWMACLRQCSFHAIFGGRADDREAERGAQVRLGVAEHELLVFADDNGGLGKSFFQRLVAADVIRMPMRIEDRDRAEPLALERGGVRERETVLVGVPRMDVNIELPAFLGIILMDRKIKGCWYGSSNVQKDVPRLVQLYKEGKLLLDELISQEIKLDDVNDAVMVRGRAVEVRPGAELGRALGTSDSSGRLLLREFRSSSTAADNGTPREA